MKHHYMRVLYIVLVLLPLYITAQTGTFDWVVIGGGPGGAVMARRLAEFFPSASVLLLEKGFDNQDPIFTDDTCNTSPYLPSTWTSSCTYPYIYAPRRFLHVTPSIKFYFGAAQPTLNNRTMLFIAGSLLGGGTSVNGMVALRPLRTEFNSWAAITGLEDYNFYGMLPYYKKIETNQNSFGTPFDKLGSSGPVSVTNDKVNAFFATPQFFISAALKGFLFNFVNHNQRPGLTPLQKTITSNSRRDSAAIAYLSSKPSNLVVRVKSRVTKILFDTSGLVPAANGVQYVGPDGITYTISVTQEVIVSGGAIESPKLLMLSGVGPSADLTALGIPVVANNPAVGQNFQEQPLAIGYFNTTLYNPKMDPAVIDSTTTFNLWRDYGLGYLTVPNTPYGIISNSFDVEFQDATALPSSLPNSYLATICWTGKPQSRGFVKLATANYADDPIIDPGFLTAPNDLAILVDCLKTMRSLIQGAGYYNGDIRPPSSNWSSDDTLIDYLRKEGINPTYHYGGSVAMGNSNAASDGAARVRGVTKLRVVDYSMVPEIFKSNPSLSIYALAEKIADLIREERQTMPTGTVLELTSLCTGVLLFGTKTDSVWKVKNNDSSNGYVFRWSGSGSERGVYYVGAGSTTYFYTSSASTYVTVTIGSSIQDTESTSPLPCMIID